jgi:FkbM family methyltransferase
VKAILKKVYRKIPFKKELYSGIRHFWLPPQKIYQHLHFEGEFDVGIKNGGSFKMIHYGYQIENEIFWAGLYGGWEKQSIQLWVQLCKKATIIVDVGANTGIYSLIAACVNPAATIYSFEPVKRVYEKFLRNIEINSFSIQPFNEAVSDFDGTAVIYDQFTEHIYSVTVNKNLAAPNVLVNKVEVKTITLNTFIQNHQISNIDLIKIDVETHEPEVLRGFSEYIPKYLPTILIEILNEEIAQHITEIISGLNYLYFNIDEKGQVKQTPNLTKSDYYNYLICRPEIARTINLI